MIWHALGAFVGMFALDFVCERYTRAVTERRTIAAATTAALMIVFSGTTVLSYVGRPLMLIPAAAGAFCGTYVANKRGKQ